MESSFEKRNSFIVDCEFFGLNMILVKEGDKYSVKGNKYGEYYIVKPNKEMTLFDKDGELASMGYKAKIKYFA
ncbi:MAG: hypothetical protein JKY53_02510 [Flavobacteriales bacterium]|nr:hypothetical protein [Flavobacteriales bacterium]